MKPASMLIIQLISFSLLTLSGCSHTIPPETGLLNRRRSWAIHLRRFPQVPQPEADSYSESTYPVSVTADLSPLKRIIQRALNDSRRRIIPSGLTTLGNSYEMVNHRSRYRTES